MYGKFFCEITEDNILVRFRENDPVKSSPDNGFQGVFQVIAAKGLLTSRALEILQLIFRQLAQEPQFVRLNSSSIAFREGSSLVSTSASSQEDRSEMSKVLQVTELVQLKSLNHRILLALLVYIFNLHNQPVASTTSAESLQSSDNPNVSYKKYLEILSNVALELATPSTPHDPEKVTEREVTLWTMVAIGSAASFSPWRLEIPFMGHMIELMEDDEYHSWKDGYSDDRRPTTSQSNISFSSTAQGIQSGANRADDIKGQSNLEKLAEYLRGYYLYGADKATLRSLQHWNG